mgnify:CR=1 FL=1
MKMLDDLTRKLDSYEARSYIDDSFSSFWARRIAEAKKPRPISREEVSLGNPLAAYYELHFPALDGKALRARFVMPRAEAFAPDISKTPLVVMFHDAGRKMRGWHHMTRYIALGMPVLALENRCLAFSETIDWQAGPDQLDLTHLVEDALVTVYASRLLPEMDGRFVATWGEGLGGGLALMCAALLPNLVKKSAAMNPLPADYQGALELKAKSPVFQSVHDTFRYDDSEHADEGDIYRVLSFVDCANFAPLIKAKVLVGTGLMDDVAPAATQYAICNRLTCENKHILYPEWTHERINDLEDKELVFLAK